MQTGPSYGAPAPWRALLIFARAAVHTSASLALAAGVAIRVVSDRLGHSTSGITADLYTHVTPAIGRDAADAIAATFAALRRRDVDKMLSRDPRDADPDASATEEE